MDRMTIDPTDYEPRPADDYHSGLIQAMPTFCDDAWNRLRSFTSRFFQSEPNECHQLGCNFDELPHAI